MFGKNKEQSPDLELFVVFDSKSKSYDTPLLAQNKEVLLRDILNKFREPESASQNKFFINAEDYSLFRIGSYTKHNGALQTQELEHIVNLHDLRALAGPENNVRALSPT